MKIVEEKVLVLNLRKHVLKKPRGRRKEFASKWLRRMLKKHARCEVEVDPKLNDSLWRCERPPAKLKVRLVFKEGKAHALPFIPKE